MFNSRWPGATEPERRSAVTDDIATSGFELAEGVGSRGWLKNCRIIRNISVL